MNLVHAGDLIKIGFGLDGNRGPSIGAFSSAQVTCPVSWFPHTLKAAGPGSGHYVYGWQTSAAWAGTCREFSMQRNDGTAPHKAMFEFFG